MRKLIPLFALALIVAACGDDEGEGATTTLDRVTTTIAGDTTGPSEGDQVAITAVDYSFQGVPENAPVGTELTLTNASEAEVHELVLIKIDDDETRPLEELLQLPEAETEEISEFVGVSVSFPGEDGTVVDGSLALEEPGRYALFCFIPIGADPEAFREAVESGAEEAPDVEGGPPHVTQGMYAEIVVTEG
ncbi:MAG: hypothetical protein ACRDU9_06145 [Acidimicrobiia bacterium]